MQTQQCEFIGFYVISILNLSLLIYLGLFLKIHYDVSYKFANNSIILSFGIVVSVVLAADFFFLADHLGWHPWLTCLHWKADVSLQSWMFVVNFTAIISKEDLLFWLPLHQLALYKRFIQELEASRIRWKQPIGHQGTVSKCSSFGLYFISEMAGYRWFWWPPRWH